MPNNIKRLHWLLMSAVNDTEVCYITVKKIFGMILHTTNLTIVQFTDEH